MTRISKIPRSLHSLIYSLRSELTSLGRKVCKSISEDIKNIYTDHYPDDLVNKELPIIIRGSLDNPDITIDIEYIIKKEIINPLKDKLLEKITDDLKEQIKLPF